MGESLTQKNGKMAQPRDDSTHASSKKRHKAKDRDSNGSIILTAAADRNSSRKNLPKKQIMENGKSEVHDSKKTRESRSRTPSPTKSKGRRSKIEEDAPMTSSKKSKQKTPTKLNEERKEASQVKIPEKNIPLQRKAGLTSGKPSRISRARLSEYQRNFMAPKYAVKPSPLLSALDVVHSSSSAIPPHSGVRQRPTSTEYISNYKVTSSPLSKSLSSTSPASPSMKLKVKDMQNPQKPFFTHAKRKNLRSEYAAQFERNEEFQVHEMRKMAEENKQKHEGSHIDPDHATQVVSPYNRCWEVSSQGSSQVRDIEDDATEKEDDAQPLVVKESERRQASKLSESHDGTDIEADSLDDAQSAGRTESVARKLAWGEEDEKSEISKENDEKEDTMTIASESTFEGRVATPKLQTFGGARRTHHDLTTPSRGGALLISPSKQERKSPISRLADNKQIPNQRTTPVAGSPTRDAQKLLAGRKHLLVRSSPSKISEVKTFALDRRQSPQPARSPIVSKQKKARDDIKQIVRESSPPRRAWTTGNIRAPIKGMLRSEEFQHCGPLGNVSPTPVRTRPLDDDALSVASSLTSARASDLLRKAQQRKSFWSTK